MATRRPACSSTRPALARRGLTGPAPRPAPDSPPLSTRLTALCVASAAVGAGFALGAPSAAAAPIPADLGQRAVALAAEEAGDPYVFGAAGPRAFDCSGLVQFVYARLGVSLPRTTSGQLAAAVPVPKTEARPGDIVFFHDAAGAVYHDGIYAGGGRMWAAPHTGQVVRLQDVYGSSWTVGRPSPGGRSGPAPAAPASLRVGSRGPVVAEVQRALGLAADGVFGPATAAAVARFQSARGLTSDGVVGTQTKQALLSGGAPPASAVVTSTAATPTPTRAVSASVSVRPTLRRGDRGPAVAELQRALGVGADGGFGPQTHAAVVARQRSAGLAQDGVVGPRTWAALGR